MCILGFSNTSTYGFSIDSGRKQKNRPSAPVHIKDGTDEWSFSCSYLFTAFLSVAPGLKVGAFFAAISTVSPVCGLRPWRAAFSLTSKVPKQGRTTFSPSLRDAVIASMVAFRAEAASFLDRPEAVDTISIFGHGGADSFRVDRGIPPHRAGGYPQLITPATEKA